MTRNGIMEALDTIKALQTLTYSMRIEIGGKVQQHPYHLGTDRSIAESFVYEKLRRPDVASVALYLGNKRVRIYDSRDLPECEEPEQ